MKKPQDHKKPKKQTDARSLMVVGSIDEENLFFEILKPSTFTVLADDLISGIYHLLVEAVNKVPKEDQDEARKKLHAYVVSSFSLVVDKFYSTITPDAEAELRKMAETLAEPK